MSDKTQNAPSPEPEERAESADAPPGSETSQPEAQNPEATSANPEGEAGAGSEFELSPEELESLLKRAEERDRYLDELRRMKAEFDNYQKRVRRERPGWEAQAVRKLVADLLPVIDNFERALEATEKATVESLAQGVSMTLQMALQMLENHKVREIEADGQPFDPQFHEAILQVPTEDLDRDGKVVDVQQKGYLHGDAIVRPARVIVAKASSPTADADGGADAADEDASVNEEAARGPADADS